MASMMILVEGLSVNRAQVSTIIYFMRAGDI